MKINKVLYLLIFLSGILVNKDAFCPIFGKNGWLDITNKLDLELEKINKDVHAGRYENAKKSIIEARKLLSLLSKASTEIKISTPVRSFFYKKDFFGDDERNKGFLNVSYITPADIAVGLFNQHLKENIDTNIIAPYAKTIKENEEKSKKEDEEGKSEEPDEGGNIPSLSLVKHEINYAFGDKVIHLVGSGTDIMNLHVEAIVNAAMPSLHAGGGICGVIHGKAGAKLQQECLDQLAAKGISRLATGEAVITKAYDISKHNKFIKWVAHTPGPDWRILPPGGTPAMKKINDLLNDPLTENTVSAEDKAKVDAIKTSYYPKLLADSYINTLNLVIAKNIKSIAFPTISTGIFQFPQDLGAKIVISTILSKLPTIPTLKDIYLVVWGTAQYNIYKQILDAKVSEGILKKVAS